MSEWPAKGDRVMYDDATWSQLNNYSRRVGRRGGTCTGRYKPIPGNVHVRWDGCKSSDVVDADWLCPFDQAKTEAPPLHVRARAALAREGKGEKARQLAEAIGDAIDAARNIPTMDSETVPEHYRRRARILGCAALRAIEAAGYRVVPVEPTEAMLVAGNSQMAYVDCTPRAVWNAMNRVAVGDTSDVAAKVT